MTAEEILERATGRFNARLNRFGFLTRQDLIDFFALLPPDADRVAELTQFLNQIPYYTEADRKKVLEDIESYA